MAKNKTVTRHSESPRLKKPYVAKKDDENFRLDCAELNAILSEDPTLAEGITKKLFWSADRSRRKLNGDRKAALYDEAHPPVTSDSNALAWTKKVSPSDSNPDIGR